MAFVHAWLFGALAPAVAVAVTWTANPIADTYVTTGPANGDLTDFNYGGAGALAIAGAKATRTGVTPPERGIFETYLRFDIASARQQFDAALGADNWNLSSASLRLTQNNPTNATYNTQRAGPFGIDWISTDDWIEGTGSPNITTTDGMTYDSRPTNTNSAGLGTFEFANAGGDSTYAFSLGSLFVSDLVADASALTSFRMFVTDVENSQVAYRFFAKDNNGPSTQYPLLTLTAVLAALGDMDGDGDTDNFDIEPFELALTNRTAYEAQYPAVTHYREQGDIDGNGVFDNFDIEPFEQLLTGSEPAVSVPEPSAQCLFATALLAIVALAHGKVRCRASKLDRRRCS